MERKVELLIEYLITLAEYRESLKESLGEKAYKSKVKYIMTYIESQLLDEIPF